MYARSTHCLVRNVASGHSRRWASRRAAPKDSSKPPDRIPERIRRQQQNAPKPEPRSASPASPQPFTTPEPPKLNLQPRRRIGMLVTIAMGALFAASTGWYGYQVYKVVTHPCKDPAVLELSLQKDVVGRYDDTADQFDADVGLSEMVGGVLGRRKKLARMCKGDVLEASCGTGRNLGYYDIKGVDANVDSLTFVDVSAPMVEICKKKWAALYGSESNKAFKPGFVVRFLTASALGDMPLAPARGDKEKAKSGKKYTTIIQTMGICSTPEPVKLINNLAKHLDVEDPEARIYLLEHGKSYLGFVNRMLDNAAQKHADLHGCWWNRDIGAIVAEAADQSGLEICRERRYHFGTGWILELKPRTKVSSDVVPAPPPKAQESESTESAPTPQADRKWYSIFRFWNTQ